MEKLSLKIDNPQKHLSQMTEIKSKYDQNQKLKIASAAKQFESMLTSMMLKSMNKTTGGMLGEEGYGNDMLDTVFEQEIASYIGKTKSLGLAEVLYKKITGEEMTPDMRFKISSRLDSIKMKYTEPAADSTNVQPSSQSLNRIEKFNNHIDEAAKSFGVDKNIIKSIIMTESAGNQRAVSSAKAKGLMQLMDSTASDMGVSNVFNPRENIFGGTKYFAQMLRQYSGDLKLALAAYNAGPQNVEKFKGVPPFEETKNYINKVLGYLNHFENEQ
ncbi:MAG: transglycosylase SLT domain-containing protein [Bacteroidota bacterium]